MSQKTIPKYTVVVPAFREEAVIESSLTKLTQQLKRDSLWGQTEIIVVSADPDSDKTAEIAENHAKNFAFFSVLTPESKVGKGRDVRLGMLAAQGEYVLFTDADLATPATHIAEAFRRLESGKTSIVIGVRPLKRIHNTLSRRLRSVVSNGLIRLLAVPGISDTQCGFKAFTAKSAQELFEPLQTMRWGFDIEILARARSRGYKIATMEISDWYDPKIGVMGLAGESDVHANFNTLKELFAISLKRLTGQYR